MLTGEPGLNLFALLRFDLWFHAEANRAKAEFQLRQRPDSDETIWFVALAEEQSALVTGYWFHGCSFLLNSERRVQNAESQRLAPPNSVLTYMRQ